MKSNKFTWILLVSLTAVLSFSFTVFSFVKELQQPKLPVLGQIKNFSLVDSNKESFLSKQLQGRVWIADFIFTTCAGVCPIMSQNMASLNRSFELVNDVHLVSISVNPEYDTPQVLADYAKRWEGYSPKWHFLTGSKEAIKDIAVKSFKIGSIEEPLFHSSKFALIDRNGFIRGFYEGTSQEEVNQIFKDTTRVLKEKVKY